MDNDRTAAISTTVVTNTVYDRFRYGMLAAMWSAARGWNAPRAGCKPELASNRPIRAVVIGELDMLVEHLPVSVPTPQRDTVNAAPASGYCNGHVQNDH
jgi:hypothetical protein